MKKIIIAIIVVIVVVGLGLFLRPNPKAPEDGSGKFIPGIAIVKSIKISGGIATVKGFLKDGCTEIANVEQEVDNNRIFITITTQSPVDKTCTFALVEFTEEIPLPLLGLGIGTYEVDVNGVTTTFELLESIGEIPELE